MSLTLVRKSLAKNRQIHVRRNLDYADMIHNKPINEFFKRSIKMIQYKAAIIMVKGFLMRNDIKISCNEKKPTKFL